MKVTPAPTALTISTAGKRAGNSMAFEKARCRRQHGADHERRDDGQEERLGDIENGDDADDQQRDQRKGNELGAANDGWQFGVAVVERRTARVSCRRTFVGQGRANSLSPRCAVNMRS